MDDFENDLIDNEVINKHSRVKSTYNSAEDYVKLLGDCKRAFFNFSQKGDSMNMYWLVIDELSLVEPFIIKKIELIEEIKTNLNKTENLIFNNVRKDLKNANNGLSLKYIHEAWRLLNRVEAVNGLLQPINKTPEQKMSQYGN